MSENHGRRWDDHNQTIPQLVGELVTHVNNLRTDIVNLTNAMKSRSKSLVAAIVILAIIVIVLIGGWINNRALTNRIEQESLLRAHELCLSSNELRVAFLTIVKGFIPEEVVRGNPDLEETMGLAEEELEVKKCPPDRLIDREENG